MALGIILGLAAAAAQSVSYLFSRLYVIRRPDAVLRLMVLAHVLMGIPIVVALPLLWHEKLPPFSAYAMATLGAAGFYILGQVLLFVTLRKLDASRVSPLLSLKILILAIIGLVFLDQHLSLWQWMAVGMSLAAAMVLRDSGGRLPWLAVAGILGTCLFYSLSDLNIYKLVDALSMGSRDVTVRLHASVVGTCLCYGLCGVAGLLLLPWAGRDAWGDLRHAVPFAASWLVGIVLLFACFGMIGVVFGNILQSTRGLISILLGAHLAAAGMEHIETRHTRAVLLRRVAAAVLMTGAIAAYLLG